MDPSVVSELEAGVPYTRPCEGKLFSEGAPRNLLLLADELADFLEDPANHPARCGVHARTYGAVCTCGAAAFVEAYRQRRPAEPIGPGAGPRNLVYEIGLALEADAARNGH